MKKFVAKLKSLIPTKRRLIQLYAALLTNANIKGFTSGAIYQGNVKNACVPGLNCYSCPGASAACPLGSLQNAFASSKTKAPWYVLGIILLYCIILGRTICGFLCPFGLIQDLLYKIKTPKLKKNRATKVLSYLKYVILVLFVVVFPLIYAFRDFPLPAFCKYICPAGTLGGAIGLLINPANNELFGMLGPLFTWKFVFLVGFVLACIFIFRFFCRFFCPLGAIYGLFNKIAILGIKLDRPKCIECGKCITECKMDITTVGDKECISCGDCVSVCPTKAISYRGGKILLPENEIPENATEEEREVIIAKQSKRTLITRIVAATVMIAVLASALVYYNVIDKVPTVDVDPSVDEGYEVGDTCYDYELELVGGGTTSLSSLRGKSVVMNFWGTWCGPCCEELPHFAKAAEEYKDEDVVFLVIHSYYIRETAAAYIEENFGGSSMIFALDDGVSEGSNVSKYHTMLNGKGSYPMTLVINTEGVITERVVGEMSYEALTAAIIEAKSN